MSEAQSRSEGPTVFIHEINFCQVRSSAGELDTKHQYQQENHHEKEHRNTGRYTDRLCDFWSAWMQKRLGKSIWGHQPAAIHCAA